MVVQAISPLLKDPSGPRIKVGDIREKDEISELLTLLIRTEKIVYPMCNDYIAEIQCIAERSKIGGDIVNESWRRKLCEWCYEVTDHFKCKFEAQFFLRSVSF
jgi:RNase P subunit RPR2